MGLILNATERRVFLGLSLKSFNDDFMILERGKGKKSKIWSWSFPIFAFSIVMMKNTDMIQLYSYFSAPLLFYMPIDSGYSCSSPIFIYYFSVSFLNIISCDLRGSWYAPIMTYNV